MTRRARFFFCAVVLIAVAAGTLSAQAGKTVYESTPVTVTATIEAIDKATRVITLKGPKGESVDVTASEQVQGFDRLKVGDQVSATYYEAVAINLRKPGEPAPSTKPSTTVMRKDRTPGSETRREQTFTVTVQSIDPSAPSLTVKGPRGRVVTLRVADPGTIQGLKAGDTVDVTYFASLLIKAERPAK